MYNHQCFDIYLEIYTPNFNDKKANKIKNTYKRVHINKPVAHEKMPELLGSVDLLILPLDFDKKSIRFARLSMPTKASEYMISGVPVIVFADNKTYLAVHAKKNKWACAVTHNNYKTLADKIFELYKHNDIKKTQAENAKKFAKNNFSSEIVRKKFKDAITQSITK